MDCGWCGRAGACVALPHTRICRSCYRRCHYYPGACPGCAQVRPLAWPDGAGRTVCAGCAGQPSIFACTRCGREDHPYGSVCARCLLRERLTELLTDPATGLIHQQLRPVFDALLAGERPQTEIYWLMRGKRIGPTLLASMARGEIPISHDTFNERPMDRSHNYLRDLLVATEVLPPYDLLLERMIPWLSTLGEPLSDHHARVLDQYARWSVLRKLRRQSAAGALTKGVWQAARSRLRRVVALLGWLEAHGRGLQDATQTDLERYLDTQPKSVAAELSPFLAWARQTGVNTALTTARSAILPRCWHDSTLPWVRSLHQSRGDSLPGCPLALAFRDDCPPAGPSRRL